MFGEPSSSLGMMLSTLCFLLTVQSLTFKNTFSVHIIIPLTLYTLGPSCSKYNKTNPGLAWAIIPFLLLIKTFMHSLLAPITEPLSAALPELCLPVQDIPIFKDRADWPLSQWEADFWFTDHVSKQASIFKMADEGRTERWFPEVLLCYLWGIFWEYEVILSLNRIFWASPVFSNPHLPHKSNTKDGHGSDKTCTRIKHLISIKVLLKCRQIAG